MLSIYSSSLTMNALFAYSIPFIQYSIYSSYGYNEGFLLFTSAITTWKPGSVAKKEKKRLITSLEQYF